jgi:hypothetical protein
LRSRRVIQPEVTGHERSFGEIVCDGTGFSIDPNQKGVYYQSVRLK